MLATSLLSLPLLYEQTVLTWHSGWQMVGFSIPHTNPALLLIGVLGAVCAHLFYLVSLVIVIGRRIRSRPVPRPNVVLILTLGVITGLLYVPYEAWMMRC